MKQLVAFVSAVLVTTLPTAMFDRDAAAAELHDMPHQHFDGRFDHNHYYFDHGYRLPEAPHIGAEIVRGQVHFWYDRGQWYRRDGAGWVVVGAPVGAFITALPPAYTTVYFGGIPYYYANDSYYLWSAEEGAYEVVDPPSGIAASGTTQPPPTADIFVYPKNGQSTEEQARDRFDCYRSAMTETGFDPTKSDGGISPDKAAIKRSDYIRAETACLDARGYSVK